MNGDYGPPGPLSQSGVGKQSEHDYPTNQHPLPNHESYHQQLYEHVSPQRQPLSNELPQLSDQPRPQLTHLSNQPIPQLPNHQASNKLPQHRVQPLPPLDLTSPPTLNTLTSLPPFTLTLLVLIYLSLKKSGLLARMGGSRVGRVLVPEAVREVWRPFVRLEDAEGEAEEEEEGRVGGGVKGVSGEDGEAARPQDARENADTEERAREDEDAEERLDTEERPRPDTRPLYKTVLLTTLGIAQSLIWLGLASYHFYISLNPPPAEYGNSTTSFPDLPTFPNSLPEIPSLLTNPSLHLTLLSLTWLYTALRAALNRQPTPLYDLVMVYAVLVCTAVVRVGAGVWGAGYLGATGLGGVGYLGVGASGNAAWNGNVTSGLGGLVGLDWTATISDGIAGLDWTPADWTAAWSDLVSALVCLGVCLSLPLNVPSGRVDVGRIGTSPGLSPEDYTTLFSWLTFSWVYPLVQSGRHKTLNEEDVWELSWGLRSRVVWGVFSRIRLILDAIGERGSTSSLGNDANGAFTSLNRLPVINTLATTFASTLSLYTPTPSQTTSLAYIYALLSFLFTLLKAEADVQHLWYGRRAATRIRSELMAAIYDKALKRRDYAGVVGQQGQGGSGTSGSGEEGKDGKDGGKKKDGKKGSKKDGKDKKKDKKGKKSKDKKGKSKDDKADDPKAGADVGKIVNLMAGDANRVSQTVSGLYFIYGAPLEIIIASTLLYQLLGISAFSGFFVLVLGWPLNSRSIRIQKGVLSARDGRMGVLNELVGAVKFIKFFAWEERWIQRALDAREKEMQWMVKARVNSVMFYLLWTLAPILVSIISFMTYVLRGNELTVSVAFTSIALFNMIRTPLNVIPAWIVQILQTGVALKRISVYLDEEEVDAQVSSLKAQEGSASVTSTVGDDFFTRYVREQDELERGGLGLENATLKWNEVPKEKDSKDRDNSADSERDQAGASTSTVDAQDESATPSPDDDLEAQLLSDAETDVENGGNAADIEGGLLLSTDEEQRFELKDVTVRFPEGKLTVITGPTASGKTALLMAVLGEMTLLSGRIIMHKDPTLVDPETGLTHSISYAAQTPWLRHQSIRENILFGQPFDRDRYEAVVDACALRMDLEVLEDGDETEIGARGVSLSGGQKARVALARAVYARTKYVLLDDPLSAVDSHTSRLLFENLLQGPLLANRTVVLVTHHVELVLPGAHYLVRMLDGRIDTQGTVEELRSAGLIDDIAFDAFVDSGLRGEGEEEFVFNVEDADASGGASPGVGEGVEGTMPTTPGETVPTVASGAAGTPTAAAATTATATSSAMKKGKKKPRKLVKDEHRETGGVKWSIYKAYLKASSYWIWAFLAFMVVVVQILGASEKLWITVWGEAYKKDNSTTSASFAFDSPVSTQERPPSPAFVALRSFAVFPEHDAGVAGYFAHHHHYDTVFQAIANVKVEGVAPAPAFVGGSRSSDLVNASASTSATASSSLEDHEAGDDSDVRDSDSSVSSTEFSKVKGAFGIDWPDASEHPLFYVGVYAGIGMLIALANVLSVTAQYTAALRASRVLFQQLLTSVVRATFRFHDTTPQGRMLNRFGKDIETIDSSLAGSLQAVNSSLASFFAAIVIIAVVFPYFLIPAAFIGLAYRELAIGYLNTGRDLRRMESNTRSPIFSDFGELLEGIVTMWYAFWMTNRWLLLNFDALGALAVLVTSLFAISTLSRGAGLAGLCITSAMTFTSSVYWACRFWTALELDLNSVERVVEYLDLPQEPPAIIESNRPPAYWPSITSNDNLVVVENLVIKYAPDLPAVLHDVSFSLKGGERIGLLGRTGSGKSTLAMSILRFVDPTEGKIIIDGIDISTIGIHDLRSRVTFIPQDATLFSGTLRENLDPFGDHTDAECLDVLRRVHMITDSTLASRRSSREQSAASSRAPSILNVEREQTDATHETEPTAGSSAQSIMSTGTSITEIDPKAKINLDTKVSAGGTNFSQGQRQLIAMARALLRKSAIVVLDEATSSIDFATDAKIQTTIRQEFVGSLLLTVAHRLRTVIDYDRLIVLDKGKIVEFDTPYNLIKKEGGTFRKMCLKSGTFSELEAAAKAKAEADAAAAVVASESLS
ncbi:ATP-binding cassette transporter [Coprinopsis cinerea okayama7|uniref:ATP-binding cassette transporter n=1 Tax=Coprinopsis cinerea (strain Okayama-7 / 130 / ATCC MYA-4618 / FGSC 9003) TaxID=240176 RepID=A8NKN9_COPC7|nr:ATP-binding cassette transporter [Coprinopsis cinerea okayama7\|eukprot:XP_001834503.2 ATP-binding cassette transporter [Coprinopsis cinerea okayama7\